MPHLVRDDALEADSVRVVRVDPRSAEDHPGLEDLGAVDLDVVDVRDPEHAGRRQPEEVRHDAAVAVVDDVDPAAVPRPEDGRDVAGVDVAQAERRDIAGDRGL